MLSGGSGKRLWPMSNDSRSKQFLKVLDDKSGQSVSMLQRNWRMLSQLGMASDSFICASRAQREIIESQLGDDVPFIEEPDRRDTFPAIALATLYLADIVGCSDDEPLVVLPIDPMVDLTFFQHVRQLPDVLIESKCDLALMGVQPTEPSGKFGYIRVSMYQSDGRPWRIADGFVEKPSHTDAERIIADGALWNCGVFCFRIGYLKGVLRGLGYPVQYSGLLAKFSVLNKRSFDYEVVEKADRISVLPFMGKWKDLGTWESLTTEMDQTFIGIGSSIDCENTHAVNELGIPLLTAGLRDAVVVATPDGILVSSKTHSANIKDAVSAFGDRPMYEERRWGSYRVLDYQKLLGAEMLTRCIVILPGKNVSYQRHWLRTEVWFALEGEGEVLQNDKLTRLGPGDLIRILPGQWHAVRAVSKLTFIELQHGDQIVDSDVERLHVNWEDALIRVPQD